MRKTMFAIPLAALAMAGCASQEKPYDATGTFEATETTVCAQQSGQLVQFDVEEGQPLQEGEQVALIDTVQLQLQIASAYAGKDVYAAQTPDIKVQIAATQEQLTKARKELRRYTELVNDGAAPSKTRDDAASQVKVLERQLAAQQSALSTQVATIGAQKKSADTQVSQLRDAIRRCHVVAPVSGVVLEKYTELGEFATVGKPLFKMADTRQMYLRAYVTSAQLEKVKVGQRVKVFTDYGDGKGHSYDGTITWISEKSEFTPKTILTDDERADLVYAVKVSVANDGFIKIGMYGELKL